MQPCLENKSLGRKQTLTYLKGYQHEAADIGSLMSAEGAAKPHGSKHFSSSGSPTARTASRDGSQSAMPKWVEENGKVCMVLKAPQHA